MLNKIHDIVAVTELPLSAAAVAEYNKYVWRGNRTKSLPDFVAAPKLTGKIKLLEVEGDTCPSAP